MDLVCRCYAVTGHFFSFQNGASKNQLLTALFNEVFEVINFILKQIIFDTFER